VCSYTSVSRGSTHDEDEQTIKDDQRMSRFEDSVIRPWDE